jgi:ABC-type nitrate/sulfonate/bicarbonate transport system substrate-binding protein
VSLQGAPVARDVPWLMSLDWLREQGYTIEVVDFAQPGLIVEALLRDDVDVGSVNPNVLWVAIGKGADLRTIGAKTNMTFRLVARREIQACRDMHGRTLALTNTRAMGKAMFDAHVRQHCPGTAPRIVIIGETANSMAALQAGEIDSAVLDLEDWLYLEDHAAGRFHVLIDFARESPEIQLSSFAVRNGWAKQNPEMVKDFLRAMLTAYRRVGENPGLLLEESAKRLSLDAASAQRLTEAYLAANVWDVNGSWTEEKVQATIDFLATEGFMPGDLKGEDVADLTYLNAVLDEIGRR